jgi:DNA-binding winged helix-turn-helix (wHTH) protein/tetratricopeptide (TPR) repeat protein
MSGDIHEFGQFRFVASARELWRGDRRVDLPRRTFECLEHLIAHRDRAVGRDELVAAIFGRTNVSDAQLGQIVLRARRAVDDDGNAQRAIRTIPGYGYRWVADVRERTSEAAARDGVASRALASSTQPASADVRNAAVSGAAPQFPPSKHRAWTVAAVLAIGVLGAALAMLRPRNAPTANDALPADAIVVLPVEVDGLREDAWVRLGAMDLVADRLREAGMTVPPSESVLSMLHAENAASAADEAMRVRRTSEARLIVRGKAIRDASGWKVRLTALPPQGLPVPVEFEARDAVPAARGASDLLLAALGRTLPPETERETAFDETLQRARAAMLANELDTARTILTSSPQLAQSPAQLNYRLAQVDFRAGRLDRAEAALDDVLGHADAVADPRFRAQVLNARGATRVRRGAFADGGRDFEAALALLVPDGPPLERGLALVGRGNTRVPEHRYDEALADFAAARVALESAGDALGVARVDANMGMLELSRGRPPAALGYLPAAADRFQSFGALHELLLTLTGVIEAELAMLQHDAALATVERASAVRERITDPDQRVDLLLNRAQVFIAGGRYREAEAALVQAKQTSTSGNRVLLARLRSLDAELAVRAERWNDAETATRQALSQWPDAGADGDRADVVLLRQRVLIALGRAAEAEALLDRAREAPESAAETPGAVADAIAMAEWLHRRGETARAARWFRFATASADRRGVPAEIVAVARAEAPLLLAAQANAQATATIGRVASWAGHDFDCALLQLRLFHALGPREAWFNALRQTQTLAGEREIPAELLLPVDNADTLRLGTLRAPAVRRSTTALAPTGASGS